MKNSENLDLDGNPHNYETQGALWRRVSTDAVYIVRDEGFGLILEGTQCLNKIGQLWRYIESLTDCQTHLPRYDMSKLKIVSGGHRFDQIKNKHWFSDLRTPIKRSKYVDVWY